MKKLMAILIALLAAFSALGEDRPDGSVSEMYRVICAQSPGADWETLSYIESEGLLMTAFGEQSEITVSIEEPLTLSARLESVGKYAEIISSEGDDARCVYTCRLKCGALLETMVCVKEASGKTLTICMTTWNANGSAEVFESFCGGTTLEKTDASAEYLALLTGCGEKNGSLYLKLDFVTLEYDNLYGGTVFMNTDITSYSYPVEDGAFIYLPDVKNAVYSMHSAAADAEAIAYIINEYKGINGQDGLYLVRFNENNSIIRIQHYNAL